MFLHFNKHAIQGILKCMNILIQKNIKYKYIWNHMSGFSSQSEYMAASFISPFVYVFRLKVILPDAVSQQFVERETILVRQAKPNKANAPPDSGLKLDIKAMFLVCSSMFKRNVQNVLKHRLVISKYGCIRNTVHHLID